VAVGRAITLRRNKINPASPKPSTSANASSGTSGTNPEPVAMVSTTRWVISGITRPAPDAPNAAAPDSTIGQRIWRT